MNHPATPCRRHRPRPWLALIGVGLFCFAGCDDTEIQTYQAPKDPPQPSMSAPQPTAGSTAAALTWTAPAHWREADETQPMRLTTYYAGEGDDAEAMEIAVSAFPGEVGGAQANINRWRDQLGQGALGEDEWAEHVTAFDGSGGVHGWTMRIDASQEAAAAGPDGMLAAIIHHPAVNQTYFIRAFGEVEQLDAHEADVVAFAKTFRLAATTPHAHDHDHDHDHNHDHDHDHSRASAGPRAMPAAPPELELTTPDGWRRTEQAASIVYATYHVGSDERPAVVVITPLYGEGGGMLANVNMWRSQLGLEAIGDLSEQPTESLTVDGREATLVAMDGQNELSLLVAIVPDDDHTWFFRLSGPRAAVHEQRDAFEQFVTRARFVEN